MFINDNWAMIQQCNAYLSKVSLSFFSNFHKEAAFAGVKERIIYLSTNSKNGKTLVPGRKDKQHKHKHSCLCVYGSRIVFLRSDGVRKTRSKSVSQSVAPGAHSSPVSSSVVVF